MMIHLISFINLTTESILLGIQISIQQYRKTQNACHEDAKIHCILTLHIECVAAQKYCAVHKCSCITQMANF